MLTYARPDERGREGTRYLAADPDTRTIKTVAKQLHALTHPTQVPVASPLKEVQPTAMTTDTTKHFSLPSGDVIPVPVMAYLQGNGRKNYTKGFKREARAFIRTAHKAGATNKEIADLLGVASSIVSVWGSARLRVKHNARARAVAAARRGVTATKPVKAATSPANGVVRPKSYVASLFAALNLVDGITISTAQAKRAVAIADLIHG